MTEHIWASWRAALERSASATPQYHDDTQHPRGDYAYGGTPFSFTISEPGVPAETTKYGPRGSQTLGPFAQEGLVAYLDGFVQGGQVFIAYMRTRDSHRGRGLARKLVQAVYDRWPDKGVDWGKVMDPAAGHLWEQFRKQNPDRGNWGKNWYGGSLHTAMPTSWRPLVAEPYWTQYDVTISSEGGAGGRKQFEIHVNGAPFANRSRLDEAKAAVEKVYGPLQWRQVRLDKMEANHYFFGPSTEWTSPTTIWVADLA